MRSRGNSGTILKKTLDENKTMVEPNAHDKPRALDADTSNEKARTTSIVRSSRDMHVFAEYRNTNRKACASAVKGGKALRMVTQSVTGELGAYHNGVCCAHRNPRYGHTREDVSSPFRVEATHW
jgi:hypothetical protein